MGNAYGDNLLSEFWIATALQEERGPQQ